MSGSLYCVLVWVKLKILLAFCKSFIAPSTVYCRTKFQCIISNKTPQLEKSKIRYYYICLGDITRTPDRAVQARVELGLPGGGHGWGLGRHVQPGDGHLRQEQVVRLHHLGPARQGRSVRDV